MTSPLRTPALRAIAVISLCAALASCAGGASEAPPAQTAVGALPNSDADFDGTFLAGTAKENNAQPGTGDFAPAGEQNTEVARRWVQIGADPDDPRRGALRDAAGRTFYFFTQDSASAGSSQCVDACALRWPPVVIDPKGKVFVDNVPKDAIGAFVRPDGLTQLTVAGHPIYRFTGDTRPGQTRGHGVDSAWFAITPSGTAASLPATDGNAR
ncbi:hypothetical protein ACFWNK_38105 [Streptomyces sp. NPDC058417]|uniref:COG4315 family predicted lipoprotein n=1 Tax=unclassified Streptomyces TaxID=2593676 RepID=UPI00365E2CFE